MAFTVKAKVKCFVDNTLREAGETFSYDGPENGNLEVIEKVEEKPVKKKAAASEGK